MPEFSKLVIRNDQELVGAGIYTAETIPADVTQFLTRQDFRDAQIEALDTYPTDATFYTVLFAAIEHNTGTSIRHWSDRALKRLITDRRHSQPDFIVPTSTVATLFDQNRYDINTLCDSFDPEINRRASLVVQRAISASGYPVLSIEEYEQPLAISGHTAVSPAWKLPDLRHDPFTVTAADFEQSAGRSEDNKRMARWAFAVIAQMLLDDNDVHHPQAHTLAKQKLSYLAQDRLAFSFDTSAAYALLQQRETTQERIAQSDTSAPPEQQYEIAIRSVMNKIPAGWFMNNRFVPPRRESEMDF